MDELQKYPLFHRIMHWLMAACIIGLIILGFIMEIFDSGEQLTVSHFRGKLASTRKYVVPILEETDRLGITERQGDIRIKGAKYDTIKSFL